MYSGKLIHLCGLVLFFMLVFSVLAAVPSGPLSLDRIAQAEADLQEIYESGQTDRAGLEASLRAVYGRKHPRTPAGLTALDEAGVEASAEKAVRAELDRHYPIATDAELRAMVEKAYPIYQKGDRVQISSKKSPIAVETIEGTITDINSGVIRLGPRSIRMRDMYGIRGNEAEVLKFDAQASLKKRAELREQITMQTAADREAWAHEHAQEYYAQALRQATDSNEKNGFVFYQERWLSSEDFITEFVEIQFNRMLSARQRLQQRKLQAHEDALGSRLQAKVLADDFSPPGERLSPEAEMNRRAEAAALAVARVAAQATEAAQAAQSSAAESQRLAEEKQRIELTRMAGRRSSQQREHSKAQLEAMKLAEPEDVDVSLGRVVFMSPWLALALAAVVVIGIFALIFLRRREDEKGLDVAKFFEGKGRLQKEFWDRANADLEHFKYVAYLFPNLEKANRALSKLSYMRLSREGNLSTRHEIEFGAYEHNQGAVCFVGGPKLNYALWREASAIWPELAQAQYFKVSTEPIVQLHLPDMNALNTQEDLQITALGEEDFTREDGAFVRCFRFRTVSIAKGLSFLEKFEVNEEGVMVLVETPEGLLKKDMNGITDESLESSVGEKEPMTGLLDDIADNTEPEDLDAATAVDDTEASAQAELDEDDEQPDGLLGPLDLEERPLVSDDGDEPLPKRNA